MTTAADIAREVEEKSKELQNLRERSYEISQEIRELEYEIRVARAEELGMPQEDRWYLDSLGQIACRENGEWHDGWGNSGPDYEFFTPPMKRLVVEE